MKKFAHLPKQECVLTMKFKRIWLVFPVILLLLIPFYIYEKEESISRTDFKLNTVVNVTIYDSSDEDILNHCFDICDQYELILSRTNKNSELYQLNNGLLKKNSEGAMQVSDELFFLIQDGLAYTEKSNGVFSIMLEPLTSLWNFSGEEKILPEKKEIEEAVRFVSPSFVKLKDNNVIFLENGAGIDLGATAKGYIADKIKEYLQQEGVEHAIINLGGNVICMGGKERNPFRIGIQKPFGERGEVIGSIEAKDLSIVSSGIYERGFEKDGVYYHHILNPQTGYPFENDIAGVTIVSKDSYLADVYSTLCLGLGAEKALLLINENEKVDGIIIRKDGSILFSENFGERYKFQEQ